MLAGFVAFSRTSMGQSWTRMLFVENRVFVVLSIVSWAWLDASEINFPLERVFAVLAFAEG